MCCSDAWLCPPTRNYFQGAFCGLDYNADSYALLIHALLHSYPQAVAQLEVMGLLNGVEKIVDPACYNTVSLDSLSHDPQVRKCLQPRLACAECHTSC